MDFAKNKSTTQALLIVRRLIDMGERKKSDKRKKRNNPIALLFLDWENAFEKIAQEGLFEAMGRMNIDEKLIRLTRMLYKNPQFYVEMDNASSQWKKTKHWY